MLGLVSALVLAALHLAAPTIRTVPFVPEHATASFAGGIAVSYVFLHLLPELTEGSSELREVLGDSGQRTPLLGLEIFLVALIGFMVFYGLQRLAERSREQGSGSSSAGVFRVHLLSFLVYNAIIGYTLILDWRTSVAFSVVVSLLTAFLAGSILLNVFKEEIPSTRSPRR